MIPGRLDRVLGLWRRTTGTNPNNNWFVRVHSAIRVLFLQHRWLDVSESPGNRFVSANHNPMSKMASLPIVWRRLHIGYFARRSVWRVLRCTFCSFRFLR